MPDAIIKRAEAAIRSNEVSIEDLIGELHKKREMLENENRKVESLRTKLESMKESYESKINDIAEKRDNLIAEADKKALSIIRNAEDSARALIKNLENAEAEPAARRELEKKRSHFSKIQKSVEARNEKKVAQGSVAASGEGLKTGDIVRIIGTKGMATVVRMTGKKAIVQAGALEVEVPLTKLTIVSSEEATLKLPDFQIKVSRPVNVPSSIIVRHMTKDEVVPVVEQYLDHAYRAGYDSVTVIHGRGEGVLRKEVQALCKRIPYVLEHNLGGPHEGGYGVTIVKFK
jgi:DNA mismatch repair protein MutS2